MNADSFHSIFSFALSRGYIKGIPGTLSLYAKWLKIKLNSANKEIKNEKQKITSQIKKGGLTAGNSATGINIGNFVSSGICTLKMESDSKVGTEKLVIK